ncbi:MAG: M48 family metalloprotease [Robiginitomaculum sp.]|nr:M48 family metalloprotease [Robiginitomaculum sp.]
MRKNLIMGSNLVILIAGLLLLGCASAPPSLTYREQLDIYKDMKIRLYQVARPIKIAGVGVCENTAIDKGKSYHSLHDYPEKLRPVAESYWGLSEKLKLLFEKQSSNISNCQAPLILDYDKAPNAYTDGESIFVTPALLNKVDDLALSLIIAHELAHIVLNHVDKEQSEELEREADRFALFMLAIAELDYRKATLQDAASKPPHKNGQKYLDTSKREIYFREVVAEIDKLKEEGKALVP